MNSTIKVKHYGLSTRFKFGMYLGKKVSEINNINYILWVQANKIYNVTFNKDVFKFYNIN